jgi:hypothetical protein
MDVSAEPVASMSQTCSKPFPGMFFDPLCSCRAGTGPIIHDLTKSSASLGDDGMFSDVWPMLCCNVVSNVNHTQMIIQALGLNPQRKFTSLVGVAMTRLQYIMHQMERRFGISHRNPALVKIDQIVSTFVQGEDHTSYC